MISVVVHVSTSAILQKLINIIYYKSSIYDLYFITLMKNQ